MLEIQGRLWTPERGKDPAPTLCRLDRGAALAELDPAHDLIRGRAMPCFAVGMFKSRRGARDAVGIGVRGR